MITDRCADLSAHPEMVNKNSPFLCLLRIKYWLLTALGEGFWYSCDHVHHVCADALVHTCWIWSLLPFSLIIAVQILITNLLTKGCRRVTIRKPWWVNSVIKRPHQLTTNPWNKTIRSHEAEAIDLGADLYDHISDHRHARSTWRQDATRARKVIFTVVERSKKR